MTTKRKKKMKFKLPTPITYLLLIIALVLIYDVAVGIPLKITTIKLEEEKLILEVPYLTKVSSKESNYIILQSFRSKKALSKDVKTILNQYEVIKCDSEVYYYNPVSDYTITLTRTKSDFLWNYIDILYEKGKAVCPVKEEVENTCHFTRTYYVAQILENTNGENITVALNEYQGKILILTIPSEWKSYLKEDNNYEFTFRSTKDQEIDTTFENIFNNYQLIDVTKTDRVGIEQIQDTICE